MARTATTAQRPAETTALALFIDREPREEDFRAAVTSGLSHEPKSVPAKFFYDQAGSELFQQICDTPEYYVTDTEIALLEAKGPEIAARVGERALIIEYGAGSVRKIRTLLDALYNPAAYVAIDISRRRLLDATESLAAAYAGLPVGAVCADFMDGLPSLDGVQAAIARRLGFFPGSTVGNLTPEAAQQFLQSVRGHVGEDGALLIGVDLKKDHAVLNRAYNDAAGVTARFNKNLLHRMRRELDADVEPDAFRHEAFYNAPESRVEMHLIATRATAISVDGQSFPFGEGEGIYTENSFKYGVEEFRALAADAGFEQGTTWTDADGLFSLHLLETR